MTINLCSVIIFNLWTNFMILNQNITTLLYSHSEILIKLTLLKLAPAQKTKQIFFVILKGVNKKLRSFFIKKTKHKKKLKMGNTFFVLFQVTQGQFNWFLSCLISGSLSKTLF